MLITSAANPKIKDIAALKDKSERKSAGAFLAEGLNIVRDIPDFAEIETYVVVGGLAEEFLRRGFSFRSGVGIIEVSESVFKKISDVEAPQGLAAVVRIPNRAFDTGFDALILDRIRDPGNLGSLLRSAAAFNFLNVALLNCADAYSPKTVRASMGGIFRLNILEAAGNGAEDIVFKGRYKIISLDMKGESAEALISGERKLYDGRPFALIIGSEADGISGPCLRLAECSASIEMKNGMESLNASAAGAIAMFLLKYKKTS